MIFNLPAWSQEIDYPKKLKELGIELTAPINPKANYVRAVQSGKLLFVSCHGPLKADGTYITGKLGKDLTLEQGTNAARVAGISILSTLLSELGDLNKIKRIVQVHVWVNSESDFSDQAKVANGCSDLLVAVFGENGKHSRTVIGANSLAYTIALTIEMVVELK